jgi:hypothetical protein
LTFYDGILLSSLPHARATHSLQAPSRAFSFLFPYKTNSNPHLAFVVEGDDHDDDEEEDKKLPGKLDHIIRVRMLDNR